MTISPDSCRAPPPVSAPSFSPSLVALLDRAPRQSTTATAVAPGSSGRGQPDPHPGWRHNWLHRECLASTSVADTGGTPASPRTSVAAGSPLQTVPMDLPSFPAPTSIDCAAWPAAHKSTLLPPHPALESFTGPHLGSRDAHALAAGPGAPFVAGASAVSFSWFLRRPMLRAGNLVLRFGVRSTVRPSSRGSSGVDGSACDVGETPAPCIRPLGCRSLEIHVHPEQLATRHEMPWSCPVKPIRASSATTTRQAEPMTAPPPPLPRKQSRPRLAPGRGSYELMCEATKSATRAPRR